MPETLGKITEYDEVIHSRYDPRAFIGRDWLVKKVANFRDDEDGRHLIVVGEPGSGKSAFIAYLAETWNCPRYFIRVDNVGGVTGVDPRAFLVSLGSQLYQKYGRDIFEQSASGTTQVTAGWTQGKAEVVGRFVDELYALPFLPPAQRNIQVRAGVTTGESRVVGERIRRLVDVTLDLDDSTLLHVAVIDPVKKIHELYPEEKVVILIDALDESLNHPGKQILNVIPRANDADFPANLRLVMTSRPGDHLVAFRSEDLVDLGDEEKGYRQEQLKDARKYISKRLSDDPLARVMAAWQQDRVDAYIAEVAHRSVGNFLYLYHFFNEVAATVQSGGTNLESMVIPKGLDDIYRVFAVEKIKQKTNLRDWVELYLPLLGILTVIREPVSRNLLAGLSRVKVDYVDFIVAQLKQFLDVISDEREDRYRLYHSSFAEYLLDSSRNRDYPLDESECHKRIATYYRNGASTWEDVDWRRVDNYGLLHLAAHLHALRETKNFGQQLYRLICKPFMWEKLRRYGSHQPFGADVKLAIEMARAEEPPNLVQEVRGWLIYARLGLLASQIPPEVLGALVRAGQAERAMGFASLIPDKEFRAGAYLLIGRALIEQGERAQARDALMQAFTAAKAIRVLPGKGKEDIRAGGFIHIALALLQVREFELALEVIRAIDDEMIRAHGLSAVMQALSWAGDWIRDDQRAAEAADRGLIKAETIEDESEKAQMLIAVALMLAQAGESGRAAEVINRALAVAEGAKDGGTLAQVLSVLVPLTQALAQGGESGRAAEVTNRALEVTETIEDEGTRAQTLSELAKALALVGDSERAVAVVNRALAVAEGIEDEGTEAQMLIPLGLTLALVGASGRAAEVANRALEITEAIENESEKAALRVGLALTLARVGEYGRAAEVADRALEITGTLEDEPGRAYRLIGISEARAGQFDRALGLTETIKDVSEKAVALSVIAEALAKAGESERAAEVANRALVAVEAMGAKQVEQDRAEMQRSIAQALANVGEFERAQVVAKAAGVRQIEQGREEISSRAVALAQEGQFDRALVVAEAIEDELERATVLSGIALALVEAGEVGRAAEAASRALEVTETIEDETIKAQALCGVALALAQAGEGRRAVEVANRVLARAETIEDETEKVMMLSSIAGALAGAGEAGRAAEAANRVLARAETLENKSGKAQILGMLALALAQAGESGLASEAANRALAAVEAIEDEMSKAQMLSFLAQALAQAGASELAGEAANRALAVVEAIEDVEDESVEDESEKALLRSMIGSTSAMSLSTIALALAQVGESGRAVEVANRALAEMKSQSGSPFPQWMMGAATMGQTGLIVQTLVQAFALAGEGKRAAEVADQALAKVLGDEHYQTSFWGNYAGSAWGLARPVEVGGALMILDRAGLHEQALSKWREQFANVISAGPQESYAHYTQLLEAGAPIIANIDEGQTLWNVYQAVMEVEGWWGSN